MITTNHTTLRMSGALNIEHLTALKLHVGVNTHGWAIVEGEAGENALEQLSGALAGREQHILTLDESGAEKCLFAGVIREAEMVRVGGYNRFHVELLSGTCLMDREVRSRSFQDVSRTYSQVAQQVCSEYSGGAAICTVGEDKTLGHPVIQYRETDWKFLMRMASHCGGVLVPETHRGLPRLWFGFPDRSFTCEFPEDAYTSGISQRYYELGGSESGYNKSDFFYYDIKSPQQCDLGWYTVFKGRPFIISEKYAILEHGELVFTYRLGSPGLGWGRMLYNEKISGMTLLGEVLETSRETLKLKLDIDTGWDPGGPYPYTWRPETGNFMYCMPQVGTRVSLYCPSYDEKAAVAVNCVRTNGGGCDRMSDPAKRSFVTEHGKEMNLYPGEMSLLGGSNGCFHLSDEDGITIGSAKPIVIIANEEIKFEAAQVETQAPVGEIVAAKGDPVTGDVDSSLVMCNNYDAIAQSITGAEGRNCVAYGSYDDAPTESGFDWWGLAFAVVGMVAAAAVIGFFSLTGVGAFVIGGLVAGAVSGALSAGKAALDAGLTGVDFLAAVGLGALVGGIQGAISGLIAFGVFSGAALYWGTSIAGLGIVRTMLCSAISSGITNALSQAIFYGEINFKQVFGSMGLSGLLGGAIYGLTYFRFNAGADFTNGNGYVNIYNRVTGNGVFIGRWFGNTAFYAQGFHWSAAGLYAPNTNIVPGYWNPGQTFSLPGNTTSLALPVMSSYPAISAGTTPPVLPSGSTPLALPAPPTYLALPAPPTYLALPPVNYANYLRMNFNPLNGTRLQKGNFGEVMGDDNLMNNPAVVNAGYRLELIGRPIPTLNSPSVHGIDGLYRNLDPNSSIKFVVNEAKFGSGHLKTTPKREKQMTEPWLFGYNSGYDRVMEALQDILIKEPNLYHDFVNAFNRGQVDLVLSKVDQNGNVITMRIDPTTGKLIGPWP